MWLLWLCLSPSWEAGGDGGGDDDDAEHPDEEDDVANRFFNPSGDIGVVPPSNSDPHTSRNDAAAEAAAELVALLARDVVSWISFDMLEEEAAAAAGGGGAPAVVVVVVVVKNEVSNML